MAITIRDVAKKLNLSITTVSRALDGYDDVSERTRQLVIRTATEIGYYPNKAARQLRKQKTETIGFILPAEAKRIDEPFFSEFIAGMGDALSASNYDLLMANALEPGQELNMYRRWINSHKVDGYILSRVYQNDWRIQLLHKSDIAFAAFGLSNADFHYPHVLVDGRECYRSMVTHLVKKGYRRFAFIGGSADLLHHIERYGWFVEGLRNNNLDVRGMEMIQADMTSAGGFQAARKLLSGAGRPEAVFCVNDETAFGAIHAAHEVGLEIGKDVAIVGFDGVKDAAHTTPSLSTIDIPVYNIAYQLAQMLLARIEKMDENPLESIFTPTLVLRGSTGD